MPAPGAGTQVQTVGGLRSIVERTLEATDERILRETDVNFEAVFFVFVHTVLSRILSSRS